MPPRRAAAQLARLSGPRSGSSTPGAASGSRTSRTRSRSTWCGLGRGLAAIVDGWQDDPLLAGARLLLEPGRFLVGPAGAYVATVVDTKTVDGTSVAILDGGVHHVLRPALVGTEHRVRLLSPSTRRPVPVTVAGPLCSGLDVLATGAAMAPPSVGDLMAGLDVGAYGFTESMPYFLSHPIPAEVVARDGRAELIRPRLGPATWLDTQLVPDLVAPGPQ
jgi:diaminopimelate decarboxylase